MSWSQQEPPVIVEPSAGVSASVIWLHGLGADGHDFEPIVEELALPASLAVRFVFPHAPRRAVTINAGYVMRAWYDIIDLEWGVREDAEGICASQALVEALIAAEVERGVPPGRIVLAGFSQGGAIALHTGLRHTGRLAGVLALSTYLPLADRFAQEALAANRGLPIFYAHGTADPVIPFSMATRSRDILQRWGAEPEFHAYPMQHTVAREEIDDIRAWLVRVLDDAESEHRP